MKRYEFIEEHRGEFAVRRMCEVLGVSASGYYGWRNRPLSARARENQKLTVEIAEVHEASRKTYGSPRIYEELIARGRQMSKNRVARLMRAGKIAAKRKKQRKITTDSRHDYPIAPNLLNRNFTAECPNQKWVCDITYIPTAEGWLYLAAVMDLFSRKIVGWAMEATLESCLVEKAFRMAAKNRQPPKGLLHHSDRGSQYAGDLYRSLLADYNIIVSMSRTGNCYDNAAMESFFSTLKCDQVHAQNYQTRQEAKTDIFGYIEGFYNPVRRHSSLGYLSPLEFERRYYKNFS
jgi:transposase InsO family protein